MIQDSTTWTWGYELELSDVPKSAKLPPEFGKWEYGERDIVNTQGRYRGIAADPLGEEPPVGGEINLTPTTTWLGQVTKINDICNWFADKYAVEPRVGPSAHGHIHVHLPGLTDDIAMLKRIAKYVFENQEDMIKLCGRYEEHPEMDAKARRYLKLDGGLKMPEYILNNIQNLAQDFPTFIKMFCAGKDGVSMGRPFRYAINMYCLKHTKTIEFRMFRGTLDWKYLENSFRAVEMFMKEAVSDNPRPFRVVWEESGYICAPLLWSKELWDGLEATRKPEGRGEKRRSFVEVDRTAVSGIGPEVEISGSDLPTTDAEAAPEVRGHDVPAEGLGITRITREQFMARAPFEGADRFCNAFYTKCDSQCGWDTAKGIFIEGKLAAAIVTTVSKRQPHIANLQLIHTFSEFRRRGLAKILTLDALKDVHAQGVPYFRVSCEKVAVPFYESLGFKFLGRQKSGCLLSMFKVGGPNVVDAIYDKSDPVIRSAIDSTRKGGLVEVFGEPPREPSVGAEIIKGLEGLKNVLKDDPTLKAIDLGDGIKMSKGGPNKDHAKLSFVPEDAGLRVGYTPQPLQLGKGKMISIPFDDEEKRVIREIVREELDTVNFNVGLNLQIQHIQKTFKMEPVEACPAAPPYPAPPPPPPVGACPAGAFPVPAAIGAYPARKVPPTAREVPMPPRTPNAVPGQVQIPEVPVVTRTIAREPTPKVPKVKPERPPKVPPEMWMTPERIERIKAFNERNPLTGSRPLALNIRGTNGSGKSFIVHNILQAAKQANALQHFTSTETGKIVKYVIQYDPASRPVTIVGPYETACGGCDAFSQRGCLDVVYDMVEREVTEHGNHVIFEGLIVCADFRRTVDLVAHKFPLGVVLLDTPFETCVANTNSRRSEKGKDALEDTNNIRGKYEGNVRSVPRFASAGVKVQQMSVAQVQESIAQWMNIPVKPLAAYI